MPSNLKCDDVTRIIITLEVNDAETIVAYENASLNRIATDLREGALLNVCDVTKVEVLTATTTSASETMSTNEKEK